VGYVPEVVFGGVLLVATAQRSVGSERCLQDDARTLLGRLASFNAAVAQPSAESRRRLVTESNPYRAKEGGECDNGFLDRALRIGFIGHLYNVSRREMWRR